MPNKKVYLDNAATTPVSRNAFEAMKPFFAYDFGNPNSHHYFGFKANDALEKSRDTMAELINAQSNEIVFTSGGTEANNLAIQGVARAQKSKGKNHIIISGIEHSSVYCAVDYLKECEDFAVTVLPIDESGVTSLAALRDAITPNTALISIMLVNNELGTIQPVKQLAEIAHEKNIPFHTDAVSAADTTRLNVKDFGVDLMTISGHKFYAPKAIGLLYVKSGIEIYPTNFGGRQEHELRGGTQNVPSIVGMAAAYEDVDENMHRYYINLKNLNEYFINRIEREIPIAVLNGDKTERIAQIINFSFIGIDSDNMLSELDKRGIAVSKGSACSSKKSEPSKILKSMNLSKERINSAIRFSFGRYTTFNDLAYTIESLKEICNK